MTLEEIEQSLPNGFHDARISSVSLDYVKREARFEMEISVSDPDAEDHEIYRPATLSLSKFLYCVIEAPDSKYPYQVERALWVDSGSDKSNPSTPLPGPLPAEAFAHWFFVNDWNSFIYVAALDAEIVLH